MSPRRSEFALIAALRERLPAHGPRVEVGSGDDAAIVRAGGKRVVISVDTTVDGVHARLDIGDPLEVARDFGWRALTTALSDLAACGAPAGEAYVAITAPPDFPDERLLAIGDGIADAAHTYDADVIGGDISGGPGVIVSVTVVGWLDGDPLRRDGAQPGDLVGITGPIGASGGGLALVLGQVAESDVPDAKALRTAYLRPTPRLTAGGALRRAGASAAIDCSDGLLADARHLAVASGVALELKADAVPIATGVAEVADAFGATPLRFAQSAGEDFELLVTVPMRHREAAEAAGVFAWIGEVAPGPAGEILGLPDMPGRGGHDHRSSD